MLNFGSCETTTEHSLIVLKEKQSKITFENRDHRKVRKIKIDGCVITEGLRCDYLLIPDNRVENYVELKGSDVSHAVKQLKRTITKVSENPSKWEKCCFIISSRCPLFTPKIQIIKYKFKKQYNAKFIIKNSPAKYKL